MKRLLLVLGLSGCAVQPTQQALQIRQTRDLAEVKGCDYLNTFIGGDLLGGPEGMQRAKAVALNQAAKLGPTHIVWTGLNMVPVRAVGDAYRCN
jgi:hypothetical protein